ncbi:MAG: SusD/RagB family nutrient-binding outer membrane lipoprotein [Chitinophagaceae bacterium]|nr:MAG: SusD/RagB family nutrient-binding outer membrane lipoprotein [Chitinophagaceae bacterium]
MKNNILKSAMVLAAGSFLLLNTGCNKLEDFGDTNQNPLGSATPVTGALLTNVESQLGGIAQSVRPALFVQYASETQYTDASLYSEPNIDLAGSYSGPLYDLQSIINKNTDPATRIIAFSSGSNENQIAIAKILKTYIISTVTDRVGDVPYSEALKGTGNLFPKYDEQEKIYDTMFKDLRIAVESFDNGAPIKGDILYGGNTGKWKKAANTLRMTLALRLSKKYPAAGGRAATEFSDAANHPAGFITSNDDNMTVNYPGGTAFRHPWYDLYNGRSDYALSKTLGDILANTSDQRRTAYGSGGATFPYGLTRADATTLPTNYAKVLADDKRKENSPVVVLSAAVSLLNLAEGIERGWVPATTAGFTSKQAYDAAITASYAQWGVAGASTYLNNAAVNFETGTGGGTGVGVNAFGSIPASSNALTANKLERIALQKYLALFPDGTQAWSEWRRTGVPGLKPTTFATNSAAGKQIPTRYVYAPNEFSLNPAKVAEAVARLPLGDVMNEKVWWNR